MSSDSQRVRRGQNGSCFVWIWLPGETHPVVAGKIERDVRVPDRYLFAYGTSYRERHNSISIFSSDLPLKPGTIAPPAGHELALSLRDALPDRWGRCVILNKLGGKGESALSEDAVDEMTYMLEAGSDRIGALDFQPFSDRYIPRVDDEASLEELVMFSDMVQEGSPVPPVLDRAILHGSSIGGARPKALISDTGNAHMPARKMIAKFSATNDVFGMVKGEFATMKMAAAAGLSVAPVEITDTIGRDVLLVERFDRISLPGGQWSKKSMVSALTWMQETELASRHVAYTELADFIRMNFAETRENLTEMFSRMTFNILCGNTDDHCRNHAAFWDGQALTLTPAYDIAPQIRNNHEASQAISIVPDNKASKLTNALDAASSFLLSQREARDIIDSQTESIATNWPLVCEEAGMTEVEKSYFQHRQILSPFAFEDYGTCPDLAPKRRSSDWRLEP